MAPTMPSPQQYNYRNHARFTVRKQGALGFSNRVTRRFVEIDECMLMAPWINESVSLLQGKCRETTQLSMRYGVNTGDWLIQPVMHSEDIPLRTGQTHYRERLLGKPFRIASPSFFQVNTKQTERLAELVRARLELKGNETLVDAYAGVGTFAVLLAPFVGRVIAVEESLAAVKDAAVNTLGLPNLEFVQGKTEEVLASLEARPDVVVLDPPRAGCYPEALDALIRRPPRAIGLRVLRARDPGQRPEPPGGAGVLRSRRSNPWTCSRRPTMSNALRPWCPGASARSDKVLGNVWCDPVSTVGAGFKPASTDGAPVG